MTASSLVWSFLAHTGLTLDHPTPPSLGERLTDRRYGFRNTFTGYEIGDAPWADADGAWHHGTAPACLVAARSGQWVELGLVMARPGADARPGRVAVVWLLVTGPCVTSCAPTSRWSA